MNQEFIDNCLVTCSNTFGATQVSHELLVKSLNDIVAAAENSEAVKKALYYGKQPIQLNYEFTGKDPLATVLYNGVTPEILHGVIGIAGEAGELVEAVLKSLTAKETDTYIDKTNLKEEIGDIMWYMSILIDAIGSSYEEICTMNTAKLKARYPEMFSSESAINRDVDNERKVLEASENVSKVAS
jgi:NTP pyrophosphatase (non-canonical NTP hydrolase)